MAYSSTSSSVGEQTEQTRRALEAIYGAAARGDLAAFIAGLHPEVEIHEPGWLPYGRVYHFDTAPVLEMIAAATS
jgi:hypothetical protein